MSNGLKYDNDKPKWELLHWSIVKGIVNVLTFGAIKYKANSWQTIDNAQERYFSALMRHLIAWRDGEKKDHESGLSHLDHVACNLMFLKHFEDNS